MNIARIRRSLIWLGLISIGMGLIWWLTRPAPVEVTVAQVARGKVERTVANTRSGTVKSCQRAKLSMPIGGQITSLNAQQSQHVEQGELLAEIWNEDLKASKQQAVLAAEAAHQEHDAICIRAHNAQREADRLSRLAKNRIASEEAVERAQSEARAEAASCTAAQAREQQATAHIAVAHAQLEKTRLYAPFSGIVAEIKGEVGEYTTPSPPGVATPPIIDLLTDDCHYMVAPIDEVDAASLALEYPVRISFDAYPDNTYAGRIRRIAPYVLDTEKQARTVELEAVITDGDAPQLLAGYSADIEVVLETRDNALRIPTEALFEEQFVLLYQSGMALEKRQVKTGISNWRYSEITSGLEQGDEVVTSLGRDQVKAGVMAISE